MLYTNLYRKYKYILIFFLDVGVLVITGIPLFTTGTKRANVFLFIPFFEEVHHSAK
jgi:hypothetical protein